MSSYPDAPPPPRQNRNEPTGRRLRIEPPASAILVGMVGKTRVYVTFALPIAVVGCIAIAGMLGVRPGNVDLLVALVLGSLFWLAGSALQLVSHLAFWSIRGEACESVTVGLLGVEFPPLHVTPRVSSALSLATVSPLAVAGLVCLAVGAWWANEAFSLRQLPWTAPSFGNSVADSVWHAGGVLLLLQMLCQLFLLPRTPGRQILLAVVASLLHHLPLPQIVTVARRLLILTAVVTSMIALSLVPFEAKSPVLRWPILFFVAIVLWMSARREDVERQLWCLVNAESARRGPAEFGRLGRIVNRLRSGSRRRKALRALEREHNEAVDESRLDGILDRLREHGQASLTADERGVLRRVSERLRERK